RIAALSDAAAFFETGRGGGEMAQRGDRRARHPSKPGARFYAGVTRFKSPVRIGPAKAFTRSQLRFAHALAAQNARFSRVAFKSRAQSVDVDGAIPEERNRNAVGAVGGGIFREGAARHGISHGGGAGER